MPQATLDHARTVTKILVKTLDPQSIVVFGGVGRVGIGNDLDLLVLLDDLTQERMSREGKGINAYLGGWHRKIAIDAFILSASVFQKYFQCGSPFLSAVIREGWWKSACYHAQQTVERAMKARLLEKGWELEKIHNVSRLAALHVEYRIPQLLGEPDLEYIDSIYLGRSPSESGQLPLGEPTEDDAKRAVEIAQKVLGSDPEGG